MAKPACFHWLRWHWRWLVGVLLTVLVVILYFVRPDFGAILGATWLYFMARYILKDQASPFPRRVGATLVVLMVLGSTFVMLIPWIFFGGRDGCRSFDPSMKNEFGYAFEDYWTLRSCQSAADWLMVLALAYSLIADHSPSSYVRESIRCIAFMFLSMLVRNASFAVYACSGSDENLDGVRDNVLLRDFRHLEYHLVARSTAVFSAGASLLSNVWCLQLVVARMKALEDAYGQPLGCTRFIGWSANFFVFWLFLLTLLQATSPNILLVICVLCSLDLAVLSLLIFRAYCAPLKVLRAAKMDRIEAAGPHGVSNQLEKETAFAIRVIIQAQVATLLANFSMMWHITSWGIALVTQTRGGFHAYLYGVIADTMGNTIGLLLLISSSLRFPLAEPKQNAARDAEDDSAYQREHHLGSTKMLAASGPPEPPEPDAAALSERSAWERKVKELASRRISAGQLLDFYARLGRQEDLMPHFDPAKSTTNDVVPCLQA